MFSGKPGKQVDTKLRSSKTPSAIKLRVPTTTEPSKNGFRMKNFIPSVSALTIGAASLAVTTALQASEGGAKPWTVRAGVSGFYNDNVYTRSNLPGAVADYKVGSFGFEVTPGFSLNLPINDGQTTLGLRYDYLLRYFENRTKAVDHNHVLDANLTHNFNTRFKINLFDSFAQAQEPQQLGNGAGGAGVFLRAEGTNFRNIAGFDFTSQLAENWSAVTGFRNNVFRFDDFNFANSLDRVEYLPSANVRYQVTPKSSVGLFYQYGVTDYDGPERFGIPNVGLVRDVNSHFVAATIDHDFAANLTGSLRGGIQYNDFADEVGVKSRDGVSPYVDGQVSYGFLPGSSCDYPDYAQAVGADVNSGKAKYGILICTTGIGISIAANKIVGIRAALVQSVDAAELSRKHNNANILCFGAKYVDLPLAIACSEAFLRSEFEGGRHIVRVDKIEPKNS